MCVVASGLEDQLLGIVVAEERPDLEEAKNQLIVSNAKMKQELKEIEDRILVRLSASEGSPVDDLDLISTLEASKVKSQEIQVSILLTKFFYLSPEKTFWVSCLYRRRLWRHYICRSSQFVA